jgi:hypothetical protein
LAQKSRVEGFYRDMKRPLKHVISTACLFGLALSTTSPADAAKRMPPIKASADNSVPACVTPGRLMSYLRDNNSRLADKFSGVATEYMRHGEALNLRWDYAFFQMIVETGFLKYTGDVKPHQNNFAGLGATGGGVRGESFSDVTGGVKAHLQHLKMYSGDYIEDPVAKRTRNIQDWKVLTKWQKRFSRPITFSDMGAKWAPGSGGYTRDIAAVAKRFFNGACNQPDPQPQLVALARGQDAKAAASKTRSPGEAKKAIEQNRLALGGKGLSAGSTTATASKTTADNANIKVLNGNAKAEMKVKETKVAGLSSAATGTSTTTSTKTAADTAQKCRVWTASYGGSKAVIIKAKNKSIVNYTVLKVNDGREKREADAYILAYAAGGSLVDEYSNPNSALEKAFQLCPEG